MNIFNKEGFNFIEVIVAVVLIGLIIASFSQLFSLSVDLPVMSETKKALFYAIKEMENLNNKDFENIEDDEIPIYDDEVNPKNNEPAFICKIESNLIQDNKKEVRIKIYKKKDLEEPLVELYSKFIKIEEQNVNCPDTPPSPPQNSICEHFTRNNTTWNWTLNPQGQWDFYYISNNWVLGYSHPGTQPGSAFPRDKLTGAQLNFKNFELYAKIFVDNRFDVYLGGRINTSGEGYYLKLVIDNNSVEIQIVKGYYNSTTTIYKKTFNYNLYNKWLYIKFYMYDRNFEFIVMSPNDPNICIINDKPIRDNDTNYYTQGNIRLGAQNYNKNSFVYFDDVCVKEIKP